MKFRVDLSEKPLQWKKKEKLSKTIAEEKVRLAVFAQDKWNEI